MTTEITTHHSASSKRSLEAVSIEVPSEPPTLSPRLARLLLSIVTNQRDHQGVTRHGRTLAA